MCFFNLRFIRISLSFMKSSFIFLLRCAVSTVVLLVISTAAHAQQAAPPAERKAANNYVLSPNDLVEIRVFQEEDLRTAARISKDGTINFPLIGVVRIAGMTMQDAAKAVRDLLEKDYLVNPQVSLSV